MSESEILILKPYCKTKGFEGKLIDLYPLPGDSKCPVSAISLLKRLASKLGFGNNENPVFAFKRTDTVLLLQLFQKHEHCSLKLREIP